MREKTYKVIIVRLKSFLRKQSHKQCQLSFTQRNDI